LDSLASEHQKFSEDDIDQMILRSARRSVLGLRDLMDDLSPPTAFRRASSASIRKPLRYSRSSRTHSWPSSR
jgi:hypothetical protein